MATYLIGNVKGPKGEDGYSPKASVTQTSNGAIISIQDADGLTTAEIRNGVDGDGNNIDLSPYATKVEVEGDFEALADTYATIDYVDQEVAGVVAPVTSVNGKTGDVNIALPDLTGYATQTWVTGQGYLTEAPVATVNGQTGTVELDAEDVGALPEDTVIPTKVSDLTNDSGFLNATTLAPYLANKQDTLTAGTNITISNNVISASGGSSFSGDYDDLTNKPDLSVYAESADLATVATTGDYTDLSNTPTIPTVPTNVSDFTNDAGYITASDLPADELPAITTGDAGKVLAVNSNEDGVEWTTASSGGGATYTAGDGISIDANNVISTTAAETPLFAMLANILTSDTGVYNQNSANNTWTGNKLDNAAANYNTHINNLKTYGMTYSFNGTTQAMMRAIFNGLGENPEESIQWYVGNNMAPQYTLGPGIQTAAASDYMTFGMNNHPTLLIFNKSITGLGRWYFIKNPSHFFQNHYFNSQQGLTSHSIAQAIDELAANKQDALPALTNNAGKVLTVNSGATGVEWAEASGGDSYSAGYGIYIDENNTIINDKPYDIEYLPTDMADAVGFGIRYDNCAFFDEFTDTDSVVSSQLVDDRYPKLRLLVYQDEDRLVLDDMPELEFVEESTDKEGHTYYKWSNGWWTFRSTLTGETELTYTLTVDDTLDPAIYVTVQTKELVPIPAEFLTEIPVDGTTIQYNSDGQLEAVSSGGGSGTSYTAGNGIDITNDEISVDTSVVATKTDLSAKQNTLTAGTGISISNNVISATGGGSGGGGTTSDNPATALYLRDSATGHTMELTIANGQVSITDLNFDPFYNKTSINVGSLSSLGSTLNQTVSVWDYLLIENVSIVNSLTATLGGADVTGDFYIQSDGTDGLMIANANTFNGTYTVMLNADDTNYVSHSITINWTVTGGSN